MTSVTLPRGWSNWGMRFRALVITLAFILVGGWSGIDPNLIYVGVSLAGGFIINDTIRPAGVTKVV